MSAFVVDTNVAVTANGRAEHAGPTCILASVNALKEVVDSGVVVLDDGMLILREYMDNLSMSGQPGAGDMFMKWVWQNQAVGARCKQVHLTAKEGSNDDFEEFPEDAALAGFDRSDRKFVAVALASQNRPEVLNAVDRDWWDCREALEAHGLRIRFLCPDLM